jgi:hypothetical protein
MALIQAQLRETGMTDEEIQARKYYNVDWFTARVPRFIPKPSVLYRRVRAVFETFGPQLDEKTKKPLFNDAAWLKADGVLKEILDGLYSDPPDENFYFYQLSALKEIKRDNLGIPLIRCTRGTNTVERTHKWMVPVFGNNPVGIELSDVLLSEMRHRMNMRAAIRNRPSYPRFGHYDTWTIDQLQNVYETVFGILLYPGWLNGSNYERTPEKTGIVPITSLELRPRSTSSTCQT